MPTTFLGDVYVHGLMDGQAIDLEDAEMQIIQDRVMT
jgi:hypothetical protein